MEIQYNLTYHFNVFGISQRVNKNYGCQYENYFVVIEREKINKLMIFKVIFSIQLKIKYH